MHKTDMSVSHGTNGATIMLGKDGGYFQGIAKKLVPFSAETRVTDEGKTLHLLYDLNNVVIGLLMNPSLIIPPMVEKGFLTIDDKQVHSYWLDTDGKIGAVPPLSNKILQRLAKRLRKNAKQTNLDDFVKTLFYLDLATIQRKLLTWRYDPDEIIPQLKESGYLIARHTIGATSYFIFHQLKLSAEFTKKKSRESNTTPHPQLV